MLDVLMQLSACLSGCPCFRFFDLCLARFWRLLLTAWKLAGSWPSYPWSHFHHPWSCCWHSFSPWREQVSWHWIAMASSELDQADLTFGTSSDLLCHTSYFTFSHFVNSWLASTDCLYLNHLDCARGLSSRFRGTFQLFVISDFGWTYVSSETMGSCAAPVSIASSELPATAHLTAAYGFSPVSWSV